MDATSRSPFVVKLLAAARAQHSLLCVGLDVDLGRVPDRFRRIPAGPLEFNQAIVDATADLVCAYKPNLAFYEALGPAGLEVLRRTIEYIPKHIPIIADAKRGDISSSARAYARAIFEGLGCDACTVNPLMGFDAVEPFLAHRDRGVFLLCRTSNPGAADFQDLAVVDPESPAGTRPLFEVIALRANQWNTFGNLGLVVGATRPDELRRVRSLAPGLPLLIPGVGTQGGDVAAAVRNALVHPEQLAIINASRQILYASSGEDFARAARVAAQQLLSEINAARST